MLNPKVIELWFKSHVFAAKVQECIRMVLQHCKKTTLNTPCIWESLLPKLKKFGAGLLNRKRYASIPWVCPLPNSGKWGFYRDPLLRNVTTLVVAVIERGPQPKDACTPIFIYEIDHFVHPLPVFQVVASVFPDTMAISSAFFVIVGTRTLLLENIRWIYPNPRCNRGKWRF